MFTSKGLFSAIECPHQDTCILPRCIFKHPNGDLASKEELVKEQNRAVIQEYDDYESRRKRQKLDEASNSKKITSPALAASGLTKPSSLTRTVSPPLLKKSQNGFTTPFKPSPTQTATKESPKSSLMVKPIIASKTPETKLPLKAAPKVEALNPRQLKTPAPATHGMRFNLLKALHDQLKRLNSELKKDANDAEEKLVLSDQAVITRALDIEQGAASTPSIYSNLVKNKILQYKRMTVIQWKEEREKDMAKEKAASTPSTTSSKTKEPPKPIETGLTTKQELSLLPRLHTPLTGLSKHGYVTSIPTQADIEDARKGIEAAKGWEVCDRCKTRFQVFPERREEDGALASGGSCTYHFGKPYWPERSVDDPKGTKREKRFRCCGEAMGDSAGCTTSPCHVFKVSEVKRLAAILQFEETPENPDKKDANPVCIDGEMGYTVFGLELIRLTATSWPSGECLFDVLVKPVGHILDLNTRYSGVNPQDMANAPPYTPPPLYSPSKSNLTPNPTPTKLQIVASPSAARTLLFDHLSSSTPIIGHGLENDLNATRLIHRTIIDTALLFPHKAGLPYRNGLKMLMSTHLNRTIQTQKIVDGQMEGHDSKEDANAAGELVRWRVGEEWGRMRREGWSRDGDVLKPPKGSEIGLGRVSGMVGDGAGRKRSREESSKDEINYG
ncbi:RNA exonuclease-like protein Rex3 [Halenospora varia]|nr:RNA exonuclease-like protein Rex3 [Halenospora varia]